MYEKWFYSSSDLQYGPVTNEELEKKFLERDLSFDTLVWKYGMAEWQKANEIENFSKLKFFPPPLPQNILREGTIEAESEMIQPPPLPKNRAKSAIPKFLIDQEVPPETCIHVPGLLSPMALRPWCRYWARTLDFNFYLLVGSVFMVLIIFGFAGSQTGLTVGTFIWFGILLGGWVLFEASLLSSIGTTPGKWLFKIKVRNFDGSILSYRQALKRTVHVWLSGTGLYIPLVCLFTYFGAYKRLTSAGVTVWDENGGHQVSTQKLGILRTIIAVILIVFCYLLWSVVSRMDQ